MSNTVTAKETIENLAAELGLTMTARFIPWSLSRYAKEKSPSLNWEVNISHNGEPIIETEYMAGYGHCPSYKSDGKYRYRSSDDWQLINWECENGKRGRLLNSADHIVGREPIMPEFASVLHSLVMDSEAIDYAGFEDWADNIGYDRDSRKAETVYRQCVEQALKLRASLGEQNLARLREAVRDY